MNWYLEPWKKFGDFSGRARRKEYWTFTLINMAIAFIIGLLMGAFNVPSTEIAAMESFTMAPGYLTIQIISLVAFIPGLAVTVRRLHDTSHSGWFVLLNLIPLAGLLVLVWLLSDSNVYTNEWGKDPKAEEA